MQEVLCGILKREESGVLNVVILRCFVYLFRFLICHAHRTT